MGTGSEREHNVLLIGGHIRSGTTLLWELCNGHPDIALVLEFGCLFAIGASYTEHRSQILKKYWSKTVHGSGLSPLWHNTSFVARYLLEMRKHRKGRIGLGDVESALRSVFPGVRIVGDKTPAYASSLDRFSTESGLTRIIIYRDCRDVASSVLKRVRTSWKGRPWVEGVDTAEKIATRWLDPAGFPEGLTHPTSIGKYKTGLTKDELETVMEVAGPTMDRLGYL
jgi:hypothetical protein